jgi:hypothetical protein
MKNELISVVAATVLAVGVAAGADRDTPPTGADAVFKSLDRDGDQRLSKSEVAQDKTLLEDVSVLFAPTGPIQEVSLSSGWSETFLKVAERFDRAERQLWR